MKFLVENAGPAAPPVNLSVMAISSRSLEFSWSPPVQALRNGVIIGYTLSCQPNSHDLPATFNSAGRYTLPGFAPATQYICSIYASTSGGSGPHAYGMSTTLDEGMQAGLNSIPN